MFTTEDRDAVRSDLLAFARNDRRIAGAAITGSAAVDREDRWSDIDLAFGVASADELKLVLQDFTTRMYERHGALHHVDLLAGTWIYRVFLLRSTLQVDIAFSPAAEFRALAPTFQLMFGQANEPKHLAPPLAVKIIGMAWLYALHARTCICRNKLWQAEYMISAVRDNALALACLRNRLPTDYGRGMDQLPDGIASQFEGAIVQKLDVTELSRAFEIAIRCLLNEIENVDDELARRLNETLVSLAQPMNSISAGSTDPQSR
jgi:hypothetical protein